MINKNSLTVFYKSDGVDKTKTFSNLKEGDNALEIKEVVKLVEYVRLVERALGQCFKKIYANELEKLKGLRLF